MKTQDKTNMETLPNIDWSDFDGDPEQTIMCHCDWGKAIYRSHAKHIWEGEFKGAWSRKPCPHCGSHNNIFSVKSDPEVWVIKKEDIGEIK